jgi:hypothetical protein
MTCLDTLRTVKQKATLRRCYFNAHTFTLWAVLLQALNRGHVVSPGYLVPVFHLPFIFTGTHILPAPIKGKGEVFTLFIVRLFGSQCHR